MNEKNLQRVLLENNISYETFNRTWQVMPESCKNFLIVKWGLDGSEYCKTITQLSLKTSSTYAEIFKKQVYAISAFEKCQELADIFSNKYSTEDDMNNAWGLLCLLKIIYNNQELPQGNYMRIRNEVIDGYLQLLPQNQELYLIQKFLHSSKIESSESNRLLEFTAIKDLKALVAVKK